MRSKASILSAVPVISIVTRAARDVDDLGPEDLGDCMISRAVPTVRGDLEHRHLARDRLLRLQIADLDALTSLCSCLVTWSIGCDGAVESERDPRDRLGS